MTIELKINKPSNEWVVFKNNYFSVVVKAWYQSKIGEEAFEVDPWCWNVYVNIFDTHPLFDNPKQALLLPLHGGVNFYEYITAEPAIQKWDWQKPYKYLKIGCDYAHLHDNYFMYYDPKDGIPGQIQQDCLDLVEILMNSPLKEDV